MEMPATFLKDDAGAVMFVMSVMILALMTIIGLTALKTANTEIKIAGNDYRYQKNFYCAEGAVIETVDRLEALNFIDANNIGWMMNASDKVDKDTKLFAYWKAEKDKDAGDAIPAAASICSGRNESMTVHHGVLPGSSLDLSKPTKHVFSIYGQSNNGGLVMIKVGYMKAY